MEDRNGHLWFSTYFGGVSRFDGRVFQNLNRRNGLPHNGVHQTWEARNGDVWIVTDGGGVVRYRPRFTPPPVYLKNVVADRQYGAVEALRLPSTQQFVLFEFQSRRFKTPREQMVYVYRLQGYEEEWRQTRENRVEYTNLPVGEYTFQVKAVDRDLTYSEEAATVALEVYYQPVQTPFRLAEVRLDDIFASLYPSYAQQPLGSVLIAHDASDSLATTLRFYIPEVMRRPFEQAVHLAPHSTQWVDLRLRLDPDILQTRDAVPLQAEISLAFAAGEQTVSIQETRDLMLYGRGALRWDEVGHAAAFITPTDPAVASFARPLLVAFEPEIKALGKPVGNLFRALVLFEALRAHGVRYVADANTPYAKVAADRSVVDHIQYPAQVLASKAGDCDDLTALYCALLESAGVATALVDYPGHLFMLFDSGLKRQQAYQLPLDKDYYYLWGDRVWIPVEVTLLSQSFQAAWAAGLEKVAGLEPGHVVETAAAWQDFAPAEVSFAGEGVAPVRAVFAERVANQHEAVQEQIDAYVEATYLEPLEQEPENSMLRTELGQVFMALQRYNTAIDHARDYLSAGGQNKASAYNQMGIASYYKDDFSQAEYSFREALKRQPDDEELKRNLERVMRARGKKGDEEGTPLVKAAGDSAEVAGAAKSADAGLEQDAFYWVE
jgi:transglutaminase-like putative cysteine protease